MRAIILIHRGKFDYALNNAIYVIKLVNAYRNYK